MKPIFDFIHSYGAYIAPFVAAYVLNVLYGHRSQVDAWCNANPKRASLVKFIRGVLPIDPWMIIQAFSLLFKGRLPIPWQKAVDIIPVAPNPTKIETKEDDPPPTSSAA